MRNHTGRMAIALGGLIATIALGSGIATAAPVITPDGIGGRIGVKIKDGAAPPTYECIVLGLGFASGPATNKGNVASGEFLVAGPVVGLCTDPANPVVPGTAG